MNENSQNTSSEINQDQFVKDVLEASKDLLVVVDFWAPWCGPCKQLGPNLEKVIKWSNGKAKLVKINIDENQELAAQLQIQSIPAVYAFKDTKILNAFQGAIPESEIVKFIEKCLGEKLQGNVLEQINEARSLMEKQEHEKSMKIINEIFSNGTQTNEVIEIFIRNKVALGNLEEVKEIIDSLDNNMLNDEKVKSALKAYDMKLGMKSLGSVDNLILELEKDPMNIEKNKRLSDYYFDNKEYEKCFDQIIGLISKAKKNEKEGLKKILFEYFTILGEKNENTKIARRKLSSLIFS